MLRHIFHVYFSLELSVSRHPYYNNMLQMKQNKPRVNYVQGAWRLTRNSTGWVLTSHDLTGCIQDLTWRVHYERDYDISLCYYVKPVRWVNRSLTRLDVTWLDWLRRLRCEISLSVTDIRECVYDMCALKYTVSTHIGWRAQFINLLVM
jgi:hypothetical protein